MTLRMVSGMTGAVLGVVAGSLLMACDKPASPPAPAPAPAAVVAAAPAVPAAPIPPPPPVAEPAVGQAAAAAAPTLATQNPVPSPHPTPATKPHPTPAAIPHPKTPAVVLTPAPKATPLSVPAQADGKQQVNLIGAIASLPADWKQTQPGNAMRVAQFATPAAKNGEVAELVVFYFAAGRGGSQEENIGRWKSQFLAPSGGQVEPKISQAKVGGVPVTRVELAGNYSRGVGMGTDAAAGKPNQVLLAAIITTPTNGNLTLHFFGHKDAVNQYRGAFDEVVANLRFSGH